MATGRAQRVLAISVLVTAALYAVPFGRTLAWPLVLVSTLAHELGHGLAAALLGGSFEALRLHADASGVALWRGGFGRFATATVAGAGLVGPAVAAFALLVLGRTTERSRYALGVLGAGLVLVALLLARNAFGLVFILILAATFLLIAIRAPRFSQTALLLIAVQLALSVFSRADYLFTNVALTSAGPMPSDVAVMSAALFLPYWFWGLLCGAISVGLLAVGVKMFLRR
jgi:hypothetical protein